MTTRNTKVTQTSNVASKANPFIASHTFKFMNKTMTAIDLANDAVKLKKTTDKADADKAVLGSKFVAMAKTCKSAVEFLKLCGEVEAIKKWKSEQNPDGSKSAKDVAPAWVQYKSNVKVAWEDFGISPDKYDSTGTLNKMLNNARKAKKAKENAENGDAQLTETIEQAAESDQRLAAILDKFVTLFDAADEDSRTIILEELAETYNGITEGAQEALKALEAPKQETQQGKAKQAH